MAWVRDSWFGYVFKWAYRLFWLTGSCGWGWAEEAVGSCTCIVMIVMERSWTLESDLPFNRFKTLGKYLCSLCVSPLAIKWGWYLLWVLLKFSAVQCDEYPTAPNTQHMHKRWQLGLLLLTAWQGNSAKFLTLNALNFSTLHVLIWPPSTSHFSHFRFSLLYLWVTERVKFENLFTFLIPVFFFFSNFRQKMESKKWSVVP